LWGPANDLITGSKDSNTTKNDFKLLEIVDTGRRRRFSVDAKRRIVEESFVPGESVSAVARRHGLLPAQLFAWRRAAREGQYGIWRGNGAATEFVEAQVVPKLRHPDRHRAVGRGNSQMEVVSANGRRVVVDCDVDVDTLLRIIRALETLR
jgi:transposase